MPLPELSDEKRAWYILQGYHIIELKYSRHWSLDGKYHREDGPALEYANGTRYWYLNGKYYGPNVHLYEEALASEAKTI